MVTSCPEKNNRNWSLRFSLLLTGTHFFLSLLFYFLYILLSLSADAGIPQLSGLFLFTAALQKILPVLLPLELLSFLIFLFYFSAPAETLRELLSGTAYRPREHNPALLLLKKINGPIFLNNILIFLGFYLITAGPNYLLNLFSSPPESFPFFLLRLLGRTLSRAVPAALIQHSVFLLVFKDLYRKLPFSLLSFSRDSREKSWRQKDFSSRFNQRTYAPAASFLFIGGLLFLTQGDLNYQKNRFLQTLLEKKARGQISPKETEHHYSDFRRYLREKNVLLPSLSPAAHSGEADHDIFSTRFRLKNQEPRPSLFFLFFLYLVLFSSGFFLSDKVRDSHFQFFRNKLRQIAEREEKEEAREAGKLFPFHSPTSGPVDLLIDDFNRNALEYSEALQKQKTLLPEMQDRYRQAGRELNLRLNTIQTLKRYEEESLQLLKKIGTDIQEYRQTLETDRDILRSEQSENRNKKEYIRSTLLSLRHPETELAVLREKNLKAGNTVKKIRQELPAGREEIEKTFDSLQLVRQSFRDIAQTAQRSMTLGSKAYLLSVNTAIEAVHQRKGNNFRALSQEIRDFSERLLRGGAAIQETLRTSEKQSEVVFDRLREIHRNFYLVIEQVKNSDLYFSDIRKILEAGSARLRELLQAGENFHPINKEISRKLSLQARKEQELERFIRQNFFDSQTNLSEKLHNKELLSELSFLPTFHDKNLLRPFSPPEKTGSPLPAPSEPEDTP